MTGKTNVGKDVLVHKMGHDLLCIGLGAVEDDAREHAVAVKPMRVAADIVVRNGIAAIAHILAPEQFDGQKTGKGARCGAVGAPDRREVAGEIAGACWPATPADDVERDARTGASALDAHGSRWRRTCSRWWRNEADQRWRLTASPPASSPTSEPSSWLVS